MHTGQSPPPNHDQQYSQQHQSLHSANVMHHTVSSPATKPKAEYKCGEKVEDRAVGLRGHEHVCHPITVFHYINICQLVYCQLIY
jgi:hypothetical protein